jgi:hypothetical protein
MNFGSGTGMTAKTKLHQTVIAGLDPAIHVEVYVNLQV